jgi:hypothetical protein
VRALADRRRRTISIKGSDRIVRRPWISQRESECVASVAAGVASAMLEGADAIAVGGVTSAIDERGGRRGRRPVASW